MQCIGYAVTYLYDKSTPLSLCSDALAAFDFAQVVSLSNGDPARLRRRGMSAPSQL
jgi:hypothetical protein